MDKPIPLTLEKDTSMACSICGKSLGTCTCPDIDQRIEDIRQGGHTIFRWCSVCDHHYARCHCEHPFWVRSDNGEPIVEANNIQKIMEANNL